MLDGPIRAQLQKILASDLFIRSERLSRFLQFTVDQTLKGEGGTLKEYLIGLEVFDKSHAFDPRTDPLVRVQARRLRAALTEYYAKNGHDDQIVIDLPRGGYVPSFKPRSAESIPRQPARSRVWQFAAAGLCVLGLASIWLVKTQTAASDRITSVAVLPFADLSPEGDQEYFCDGLTEEIIDILTKVEGLRVPARTSSFQFKGTNPDLHAIGDRLKVNAVLEGSVRKSGNRVRITVQLVKVADGYHVWSETLDREMRDVFAIQEELSSVVATRLNVRLPDKPVRPQNPEAYTFCLQGRFHFNQWTRESMRKSVAYFEQAVAKDPKYALAYAGLADSHAVLAYWGAVPAQEGWSKNQEALDIALRLDPLLAEAHVVLAMRKAHFEWDWPHADQEFRRALDLNPRSTQALGSFAVILHNQGRFGEADAQLHKALDLDPLSARLRTTQGIGRYWARQYDQAIDFFRQVLELEPNFPQAQMFLGAAYAEKGMFTEAMTILGTARRLAPTNSEIVSLLGYTHARASRRDKAREILSEMKQLSKRRPIPALDFATVYIALSETELALASIERACEAREGRLVRLKVDPRYDPLRSEPRFRAVLKTIGFAS